MLQMPNTMPVMAFPFPKSNPFERLILFVEIMPVMSATRPQNGTPMKEMMPQIIDDVANGRFWGCAGVVFICAIGMPFKSGMVKDFEQYGHVIA